MSKFKQVAELGGVQLGDVWSDQGRLLKVLHIDSNTDKPMPILCAYSDTTSEGIQYHNEVHMVSDCELVERDGQEVEQESNLVELNVHEGYLGVVVHNEGDAYMVLWFSYDDEFYDVDDYYALFLL